MVGRVLPTAMCVRGVDDLCVLQFTLIIAAGCALHRRTSRVIHRIELYFAWFRKEEGATSHLLSRRGFSPRGGGENTTASMQATRGPLRIPTRRRHRQQSEREPKVVRPTKMTNGRDERSCEDGHKRENPYTARRFFNPLPQLRRKECRIPGRMLA